MRLGRKVKKPSNQAISRHSLAKITHSVGRRPDEQSEQHSVYWFLSAIIALDFDKVSPQIKNAKDKQELIDALEYASNRMLALADKVRRS